MLGVVSGLPELQTPAGLAPATAPVWGARPSGICSSPRLGWGSTRPCRKAGAAGHSGAVSSPSVPEEARHTLENGGAYRFPLPLAVKQPAEQGRARSPGDLKPEPQVSGFQTGMGSVKEETNPAVLG